MSIIQAVTRTRLLLLALVVAAVGCTPQPQSQSQSQSPNQVTDSEVSVYQAGILNGCKLEGQRHHDKPEHVEAFCNCMMDVLKKDIPHSDWQRGYLAGRQGRAEEERKLIFSHLDKAESCRALQH